MAASLVTNSFSRWLITILFWPDNKGKVMTHIHITQILVTFVVIINHHSLLFKFISCVTHDTSTAASQIKIQLMNVTNATFACKFQKLPYQMDHKQIWLCLPVLYMHQYFARQLLPVQISATRKLMYIFNINITWLLTNNSVYSIVPKQVCMHKNVHIKFDSEFAHQNINHSKMLSPQHRVPLMKTSVVIRI